MQDYIYYIYKNGEFQKFFYNEIVEIIDKESILIKTISSYIAPVYLYKKQNDIKWKVILKFYDFIDFIIKNENNIILYTFQPKNIEHITKAIHERKESIKHKEEQNLMKEYIPEEYYKKNNLFVATISCNKEFALTFGLSNDILNQKFILELKNNSYIEIFSGIIINNGTTNNCQFSIIDIEPLNAYIPNINKEEVSILELLLLQNKINSKKNKKRYIRRKSS